MIESFCYYLSITSSYFSDSNCLLKSYSQALTGFYQLTQDGRATVSYSNSTILPEATIIAASFNALNGGVGFCKIIDWSVGQFRLVNDVTVCGIPASTIYKLERFGIDKLYVNDQEFIKK